MRQTVFVLCVGSLAGVLIWSKLRLVTDIPRSAYAVPENGSKLPIQQSDPSALQNDAAHDPDSVSGWPLPIPGGKLPESGGVIAPGAPGLFEFPPEEADESDLPTSPIDD